LHKEFSENWSTVQDQPLLKSNFTHVSRHRMMAAGNVSFRQACWLE